MQQIFGLGLIFFNSDLQLPPVARQKIRHEGTLFGHCGSWRFADKDLG